MTVRRLAAVVAALIMVASATGGARAVELPSSYMPNSHRVYDFLNRMDHKFGLNNAFLGTRPMLRSDAARLLYSLSGETRYMTGTESEEFACLMDEFRPDYLGSGGFPWDDKGPVPGIPSPLSGMLYRNRRNLYSTVGDNYTLYLDPVLGFAADTGDARPGMDDERVYTSYNGFRLRGTTGDHIGFFVDVRDAREWGSRDYGFDTSGTLPGRGFASLRGDSAEFDETYANVTWTQGIFVASFDRNRAIWGRGERGTLMLSGYGAPYDMLRVEARFWKLRFTSFAAELYQYPEIGRWYYPPARGGQTDSTAVSKHLSGHRLEINLTDRLNIGLNETVVYGGDWDLGYLNPLVFLKGMEHANGDHDNAAMGLDFRFRVHRSHTVYGELVVDDITTGKLGTDWYGNKLGWQLGTFLLEPFGIGDTDIRLEYARIRPWIYTNRLPIDTYTHYGDGLGHVIGPNSDEFFAEVRHRFNRRLHTGLSFVRGRHGANPPGENIGGDIAAGHAPEDGTSAHFLAGDLSTLTAVSADVSCELLWELFLKAGLTWEDWDGDGIARVRFSIGLNE